MHRPEQSGSAGSAAVINDWVSDAAGKTPELRQGRHTTLFLVLTKFDMEFEKKKGAVDDETRWSNRLHASLLDFLANSMTGPNSGRPTSRSTIPTGSAIPNSAGKRSLRSTATAKPASVPNRKPMCRT